MANMFITDTKMLVVAISFFCTVTLALISKRTKKYEYRTKRNIALATKKGSKEQKNDKYSSLYLTMR